MKKLFTLVPLAVVTALLGCATTPIEATFTVETPKEGNPVEIVVQGVEQQNPGLFMEGGVIGLDLSIRDTSSDPVTVKWSKSTIDYYGESHGVFLSGQKYMDAGRPVPDRAISPGSSLNVGVYSSDSPYYESGQYGGWRMRPIIKEGEVSVLVCIESNGQEYFYTARAQIRNATGK